MQVTRPLRQRRDCKPKALATDTEEDFTGEATLREATVGTMLVVVIEAVAMAANGLQNPKVGYKPNDGNWQKQPKKKASEWLKRVTE
jgi:hypothetical protein